MGERGSGEAAPGPPLSERATARMLELSAALAAAVTPAQVAARGAGPGPGGVRVHRRRADPP